MKCVRCDKEAEYVWFGVSLCEEHLKGFARKVEEVLGRAKLNAESFRIMPCEQKLSDICVYIICEGGTEVVVHEKLMKKIVKEWKKLQG